MHDSSPSALNSIPEEQEQVVLARFLATLKLPESRDCPQSNQPNANPMPPMAFLTSVPPTSTSVNACYQFQASSNITPDKDHKPAKYFAGEVRSCIDTHKKLNK